MNLIKWVNVKIKKFNLLDIGFIKLSVAAFILMIAKLWLPILSLKWYWYLIIFIVLAIKPLYKIFKK